MLLLPLALALTTVVRPPLFFEANSGQAPADIVAQVHSGALTLDVLRSGLRLTSGDASTTLAFDRGGAPEVRFEAPVGAPVRAVTAHGTRAIAAYERVVLGGVWPGIDVVVLSREGQVAFDLVVAPGARPDRAGFLLEGDAKVDAAGALMALGRTGKLALGKPVAAQHSGEASVDVPVAFAIRRPTSARSSRRTSPASRSRRSRPRWAPVR